MATKFLRKIILEELRKVLKEADYPDIPGSQPGQTYTPFGSDREMSMGKPSIKPSPAKSAGDPKIKKLQNLLASAGYNVGKVDGIAGPLLFKAISDANKDMSGVGVAPERVAKDFRSAGSSAADNFISMFSDPTQVASLRKGNVKKELDKAMAPTDAALGKQAPSNTGVTKPVKPEMPQGRFDTVSPAQKAREEETKRELDKFSQGLGSKEYQQEAIVRELKKLLRNI